MTLRIAPEVVIENIDQDVLALDGNTQTVHRFTGSHAEALISIKSGEPANGFDTEIEELTQLGLLTTTEGLSRRSVLLGGSVLAGSTAVALSMPVAAMAQSGQSSLQLFGFEILGTDFGHNADDKVFSLVDLEENRFEGEFGEGETWTLRILSGEYNPNVGGAGTKFTIFQLDLSATANVTSVNGTLSLSFSFGVNGLYLGVIPDLGNSGSEQPEFLTARLERGGFQTNVFKIDY